MTMKKLLTGLAMLALSTMASTSSAQTYPTKPIKLILGITVGGPSDLMARTVAQALGQRLGVAVVVENKPGVGGNVAADFVAKSAPDGYTLMFGLTGPLAIAPTLYDKLPYDPIKDFAPIGLVGSLPLTLVVPNSLGITNLKQLLELAKAKPGSLTYASSGGASTAFLAMELLKVTAGVDIRHVPYKGASAAQPDIIAGRVDMGFDGWTTSHALAQAGKLRQIAIAVDTRLVAAPDLPTIAESGFPGFNASPWYGILAPAGTPEIIVEKLSQELKNVMNNPAMKERFSAIGMVPLTSTPAEFSQFIKNETLKWRDIAKRGKADVQ